MANNDWCLIRAAIKDGLMELASQEDGAERISELSEAASRFSKVSENELVLEIIQAIWEIEGEMGDWE